jgi:hypothetical protein
MMANVGIDVAVGAIPIAGDLFDFAWKANTKNLNLFKASVRGRHRTSRDWGFLAVVLAGMGALIAIPILIAALVIQAIF